MITIEHLPWDSDFLGKKIAKITADIVSKKELEQALLKAKSNHIELVYLILQQALPTNDSLPSIHSVGGKVLYQIPLGNESFSITPNIAPFSEKKLPPQLYELAYQSGLYSRFSLDKKLPPNTFKRMYKIWIENSVAGTIADQVFVYWQEGVLAGMVTVGEKNGWGDIGLIAVDKSFRGQKIGHHLINAAKSYCISKNLSTLGVETQLDNLLACSFYEKNNFKVAHKEYIYHCWL